LDSFTIGCIAAAILAFLILLFSIKANNNEIHALEERLLSQKHTENDKVQTSEDEVPPEIVAAISAAIAYLYPGAQVRKVRRSSANSRNVWQMAGLLENTRPF
jgi:hypothetical protein